MKIVLGCDPRGCPLKAPLQEMLAGHEVLDLGEPGDYYRVAVQAARLVASAQAERAILVCGSGMGMAIMANKVRGAYAAVCETAEAARGARRVNNANILTLGAQLVTPEQARPIVEAFLATEFSQDFDPELQEWLRNSLGAIERLESEEFLAR